MSRAEFNQANRDAWVSNFASQLAPGTRVLDVGAGGGRYRNAFGHCDYRTHDFARYSGTHAGLMREEWAYTDLDYVSDATNIPVADGSFDVVVCTEVIEHVPEPISVLREISRILRREGQLFLSAPLGSGLHQEPFHFYGGFTPHFYRRFLTEAGLDVVSIEPNGRFFLLLLQELHRAAAILHARRRYSVMNPIRWALRGVTSERFAKWLARLDQEIPIEEFTVGYHVKAIKVRECIPHF